MRDRHVLCTGGTGALGSKVTTALVRRGARVTVPSVSTEESERLVSELGSFSAQVLFVKADLRDEEQVRKLVDGMPRIDALVHLVGGFTMGPTHTTTVEQFREQFELNVTIAFLTMKHALRRMREADYGRIVTVGSRAALEPSGATPIYSAAKAALLGLTTAVADETKGTGITANCVLPSIIDTPANRRSMTGADTAKWVKPERLAQTIAFLASDEAGDIRGSAVRVYGSA
jgi:NAD(P)-dependent dehydrogenase (short-subunit alcohol dehydrogenase family)